MNDNSDQNNSWVDLPSFMNNRSRKEQSIQITDDPLGRHESATPPKRNVSPSSSNIFKENVTTTTSSTNIPLKERSRTKKKKRKNPIKITLYTLLALSAVLSLLIFTPGGQKMMIRLVGEYIYGNFDYKDSQQTNGENVDKPFKPTDKIINILLIGVEEFDNARNTDSMIIATMNTQDHTLKLTSLMRDMYMDIPGHGKNRLNAAYSLGGINLLTDTISQNLDVTINGYCLVNFDAFEKLVNIVHGVKITLTEEEAQYLNTTNYISIKKYRNVQPGTQTLNGNQALGYCRIRKRPTTTESNDFGRTQRHRIVLNAIFDKVKSKNFLEMGLLMNKILKNVNIETNITPSEFNRYLEEAVSLKVKQLDTFRVPTDDNYENIKVTIGSLQNREVLTAKDWDKLRADLKTFIEGSSVTEP